MAAALALQEGAASAQPRHFPLESIVGLRLVNATAEPATLDGKRGIRVTTPPGQGVTGESLLVVEGLEFANGIIEAEIAGMPAPDAPPTARGFVGIAFRVQDDLQRFEQIYLRPTNGRADDQERRNHSVQYTSHPDWPFFRMRKEFPERYESYVDLVAGAWTQVRIEVRDERARLYVHGQEQPTLIVNDLKMGGQAKGGVALSPGVNGIAHFRNLTITPWPNARPTP
jgi:hypothetical protein